MVSVKRRVDGADWAALTEEVDEFGCALTPQLLTPEECRSISALYNEDGLFRSTIDMARYRFGSGQYRYFDRPLPTLVHQLQSKSTPILLRYKENDWNALHRDLYGDLVFPLQVVIGLDEPGVDHTGGEFLLVEQRPRAQSKATATLLPQGHGLVFTTRDRPVASSRGWSAAPVRHGVSVVRSGVRHTLGLVFHDAA
jgi:hypothetical protein